MKKLALTLLLIASFFPAYASSNKVLGKLGQLVESAPIRSRPSTRAGVYWNAKPYEYIIIKPSKYDGWLEVVMQNLAKGYVRADAVARLPYDVSLDGAEKPVERNVTETPGRDLGSPTSRSGVAQYALKYIGTPYKWGGEDIWRGIDCSAFVKQLYGKIGVSLPRTAAEQALVGTPITRLEDLRSGDRLYFWSSKRRKIGHTGIYMGNGYFVHSSVNNRGVQTDPLNAKWRKILVAARR